MNWKRIILAASLVGLTPFVVGFLFGLLAWLFIGWVGTKAEMPALPSWSPELSALLVLAVLGVLGAFAGAFLRGRAAAAPEPPGP